MLWDFSRHFSLRGGAQLRYAFIGGGYLIESEDDDTSFTTGDWNYDLAIEPYIGIAWNI